jgi:hypothetical protein
MKTKILHLTIAALLLPWLSNIYAQGLDVLEVPKEYKPPTEEILSLSIQDVMNTGRGTTGEYWDVIIKRDNVPCYALSNGTTKIHTLSFLERMFVNGVEGEMIHVYKPLKEFVLTNNDVEDYGWVKKDDLLLWRHSIVTDIRRKIAIKGMVLNKVDFLTKKGKVKVKGEVKNDLVPYYSDPALQNKTGDYSQLFNILYIYDTYPPGSTLEESTSVLLGQSDAIVDISSLKNNIKGWVPSNRVTFWENRLAVEPNTDGDAVEERKNNKTPVLIFQKEKEKKEGEKEAIAYANMKLKEKDAKYLVYRGKFETRRKIGTWMRFPIINDNIQNRMYELGVMGALTTRTGKVLFASSGTDITNNTPVPSWELIKRKLDSLMVLARNVNIVFVIDGTRSMGPYFSSLAKTLSGSIKEIEANNPKNHIKYGATVYRDAAEGNRLIENSPLNASKEKLVNFLSSVKAEDKKDNDKPEAVFYGLKNALMSQFTSNDETNIIILVGDAGDHAQTPKTKVTPDFLASLISNRKCSMLVYQVHNEGDQTYIDFQNQIKGVLQKAADNMYSLDKKVFESVGMSYAKPQFIENGKNTFVLKNYPPLARVVTSPLGGKIDPAVLSNNIKEIIAYSQDYLEKVIEGYKKIIREGQPKSKENSSNNMVVNNTVSDTSTSKYTDSYNPGIIQMLRSSGLSDDELRRLCMEKFQLYTKGIAPKQIIGQTYPLFKRNLLLSNTELIQIVNDIHRISEARSNDERRNAVVDAWIGLLNKYYGNENEADLKKMKIEEIQAKVFGLSSSSENVINKYTLQDLMDPAKVSNAELLQYLARMEKKYSRLKKIINNKNDPNQFYIDEKTFYWISEDYLP